MVLNRWQKFMIIQNYNSFYTLIMENQIDSLFVLLKILKHFQNTLNDPKIDMKSSFYLISVICFWDFLIEHFQVTITSKTAKCANTCLHFRQKHDSQVVINFNQFHSPLESCQDWNLSPFQVCTIASTDPIFNSKVWLRIYLP